MFSNLRVIYRRTVRSVGVHCFIVSFFSLLGCGLNVGEKGVHSDLIKLKVPGLDCLSQTGKNLDSYFKAQSSESQIDGAYRCVQETINAFKKNVRGAGATPQSSPNAGYTPLEVAHFLEKENSANINPSLLDAVMKFKVAFLGGTEELITQKELDHFQQLLEKFRVVTVQMLPHMSSLNLAVSTLVYSNKEDRLKKSSKAGEALVQAMMGLGDVFQAVTHPYAVRDLIQLVVELARFKEGDSENTQKAQLWGQFIAVAKPIMVGGSKESIEAHEWPDLLRNFASWYMVYIQGMNELALNNFWQGVGFDDFVQNVRKSLDLIDHSIQKQNRLPGQSPEIKFSDLVLLYGRLMSLDVVPTQLSAEVIQSLFENVFTKVFRDQKSVDPQLIPQAQGISSSHVMRVLEEFNLWAQIQQSLFSSHQQSESKSKWELLPLVDPPVELIRQGGSNDLIAQRMKNQLTFSSLPNESPIASLVSLIFGLRPLFRPSEDRVYLAYDFQDVQGFYNASVINTVQTLLRLLILGYSGSFSKNLDQGQINANELAQFYQDIGKLAASMGWYKPSQIPSVAASTILGSLFTYLGNRNPLHPNELVKSTSIAFGASIELASTLFSALNLSNTIIQETNNRSCPSGPVDSFGRSKMNRSCLRELMVHQMDQWIQQLPKMEEYWQNMAANDKVQFVNYLFRLGVTQLPDQEDYLQLVSDKLEGTRLLEVCKDPGLYFWERKKYKECLKENKKRLEVLPSVVNKLYDASLVPAACGWSGSKEITQEVCDWVSQKEILKFAQNLHFIEVVMTRYDVDQSGWIDKGEAEKALPEYKELIRTILVKLNRSSAEQNIRNAFFAVLSEGKIPTNEISYDHFMYSYNDGWPIHLSRLDLIKVFDVLLNSPSPSASVAPEYEAYLKDKIKYEEPPDKTYKYRLHETEKLEVYF